MSFLDREAAPFAAGVWDQIDAVARRTVAEAGVVRRLLKIVGPMGMDARVGIGEDEESPGGDDDPGILGGERAGKPHLHMPKTRTLPLLHTSFRLGLRSLEAFSARGEPFDTRAVAEAARVIAQAEDSLVFAGDARTGIRGLLTSRPDSSGLIAGDWNEPGRAADDLLAALGRLDHAGRHGPFAAALPPSRFYALFRPYPGTSLTPHAQLAPLFEAGIHKAPTLGDSFLVLVKDEAGPRLQVGQELAAAYDGRDGVFHRFSLLESATLLPGTPGSVAVIRGATSATASQGAGRPAPDELM